MPSDSPASKGPRGSELAELRAELVKAHDDAKCLRAGVREPTYDGPKLTNVRVRDGQELVHDEASGGWRPLTEAEREQERLARAAEAQFVEQYEEVSTSGLRLAVSVLIQRSLRPCLTHFAKLANRVVAALDALRPGCFSGVGLPSMDVGEIRPGALHHCAFGTDDVVEAGRRMLAWSAWADEGNEAPPFDYGIRYNAWSMNLIAIDEHKLTAFVRWEPFNWALAAFDKIVGGVDDKSPGASEAKRMANAAPVDLKGERFRRLHRRFLAASEQYPYLRHIAATGHNNCPGWPDVPYSASYNHLGLAHKDWLDVTHKRPGTFFVGVCEHWLEIDEQLWHGSYYFDGPVAGEHDHDALQLQSAEIKEAIEQFELLANEAAGFLGNLPSVHPGIHLPRKPELAHRWLEAVCAAAPIEPARYHCFDVRRVSGSIFQASAILLERMHAAPDKPEAPSRPHAPLNIDGFDLRPTLAAAEAFLAERRKADERDKFDDGGAAHILGIARLRLAEALTPFKHPDGLIGDEAIVGAVNALLSMAADGRADSGVERIEAVIDFLRNATGETQHAAASGSMTGEAEKAGQVQPDEQLPAQQEPPLPPAGYMGLGVDDKRRTITRDGFTATINLQTSALQWAVFKKLAGNRDVPLSHDAIRAVWATHGVESDPSDGTVNDAVSALRAALKPIGITIVSRRKLGRLLAELPKEPDGKRATKKRSKK